MAMDGEHFHFTSCEHAIRNCLSWETAVRQDDHVPPQIHFNRSVLKVARQEAVYVLKALSSGVLLFRGLNPHIDTGRLYGPECVRLVSDWDGFRFADVFWYMWNHVATYATRNVKPET